MDRLEAMALLIAVAERGNFSAAARHLRMPATTVTRKISDLETSLGAKLLLRSTRKLSLTDAGADYLGAARRILDQVEEAERAVVGEFTEPKGELVITAPVQFGQIHVLPVVGEFLAQYPQISVRLLLLDRNMHLVEDQVDMAVRIGELPDSSMIATRVGSMRTVVCATPKLLHRHGEPRSVQQLQQWPCVTFDVPMPSRGWQFYDPDKKALVLAPVESRLSVTSAEAALRAALMDIGATRLLHYQVADAVRAGKLRIILERFEPTSAPVSLLHAARGQMPMKMCRFLDFAAPRLRRVLQSL